MAGRKNKRNKGAIHLAAVAVDTSVDAITPDQYERGWNAFFSGGTLPEVQAASGMTRKQFEYLLSNPLPGHAAECPGYSNRLSEIVVAMRMREVESAAIVSEGVLRNIKARDNIARMAEIGAQLMTSNSVNRFVANARLDPTDPNSGWRPNHKLTPTSSEIAFLKFLREASDYSKIADTFHRVYSDAQQQRSPMDALPKGSKVDFTFDPGSMLPAIVTTATTVSEANKQSEEDFHQRLFRNFEDMSEEELEDFLRSSAMPESELRRRQSDDDDGPQEL